MNKREHMIMLMMRSGASRAAANEATDLAQHAVNEAMRTMVQICERASERDVETMAIAIAYDTIRSITADLLDSAFALVNSTKAAGKTQP